MMLKIRTFISIFSGVFIALLFNRYLTPISTAIGNITIAFMVFTIISETIKRQRWKRHPKR